ncbi:hypothetical protein IFM89_007081 [Coptis chinensis]|uniref:Uncharacterized protein n=1 Tax=Coptis chinensis TaxID=261450 RepID=A0A835H202_9MAGN|nr:hypothetical protein IFM89_007081 [Coptis chinensis]
MEAAITSDDVVRAVGVGAIDDIGSVITLSLEDHVVFAHGRPMLGLEGARRILTRQRSEDIADVFSMEHVVATQKWLVYARNEFLHELMRKKKNGEGDTDGVMAPLI